MAKLPVYSNGGTGYKTVGFFGQANSNGDHLIHNPATSAHKIEAEYVLDYDSSVWIEDKNTFDRFANTFEVISGGWYGPNSRSKGGRWRTAKRTFGKVEFVQPTDIQTSATAESNNTVFNVQKAFFSNPLVVNISNSKIGKMSFKCTDIIFYPSHRIYLYDKSKRSFVDFTEHFEDNGLKLRHQASF